MTDFGGRKIDEWERLACGVCGPQQSLWQELGVMLVVGLGIWTAVYLVSAWLVDWIW